MAGQDIEGDGIPLVRRIKEHDILGPLRGQRRPRGNELKPLGRAHALHIANVHAALLRQTKSAPEKIVLWRQDPTVYDEAKQRDPDSREITLPVRPDAYFVIQHPERPAGKNQLHCFLEADRSTMSHEAMSKKLIAYLGYHEKRRFEKKYPGMKSFRVLVVTETRAGAKSLNEGLQYLLPTVPLRRAYRFIALEDLKLEDITGGRNRFIDESSKPRYSESEP